MGAYIDAVGGPRMAAILGFAFLAYVVLCTAPGWWPVLRARSRHRPLPRRALFSLAVALLSYGLMFLLLVPVFVALSWIGDLAYAAPHAAPHPLAPVVQAARMASRHVAGWAFVWLPPVMAFTAAWVTHRLARRWRAICSGLDA